MDNNTPLPIICSQCQTSLPQNANFCFSCGKKIKEPPVSISIMKQIGLYALSFFLPPLGLWPAIKYLRQPDQKARIVGIVCIILTIVSIILTVWTSLTVINTFNSMLSSDLTQSNLGL